MMIYRFYFKLSLSGFPDNVGKAKEDICDWCSKHLTDEWEVNTLHFAYSRRLFIDIVDFEDMVKFKLKYNEFLSLENKTIEVNNVHNLRYYDDYMILDFIENNIHPLPSVIHDYILTRFPDYNRQSNLKRISLYE